MDENPYQAPEPTSRPAINPRDVARKGVGLVVALVLTLVASTIAFGSTCTAVTLVGFGSGLADITDQAGATMFVVAVLAGVAAAVAVGWLVFRATRPR